MQKSLIRISCAAALLVAGGLGGCGGGGNPTDAGMGTDSGPPPVDSGPPPVDSGPVGDGNDSFADADPIEINAEPTAGVILAADSDYYSFTGTAGTWMVITTAANPDDNPEMIDTVITLYDASMRQIAENDDAQPRVNTDSEIITRLPADGTYYVRVQEFSQWAGETPEGMDSFTYELSVGEVGLDLPLVNLDGEGGDDVASAQTLTWNSDGTFGLVLGDFNDATDVDVFSLNTRAANPFVGFTFMVGGTDGNGSTTTPARAWITNADGSAIIARVAPGTLVDMEPSLPSGDYLLFIEHGTAGANDFYVFKAFRRGDNPPEIEPNDDVASAQALTLEPVPDTERRSAFVLARLGDADVDLFSIDVMSGEVVSVFCGSRTSGSGVNGLRVEVLDAAGAPLATPRMATESATEALALEEAAVPAPGTYLLRFTKTSQDPEVTGDWARCGIHVGPPAP